MTDWFARSVLHVTDVDASIRFYVDRLGFSSPWRFEEDGKTFVAQVERQDCALILSSHWPEKVGKGLMFISLNVEPETHEAAVAALDALRTELEAKGAPVKDGQWGYRLLVVGENMAYSPTRNIFAGQKSDPILLSERPDLWAFRDVRSA